MSAATDGLMAPAVCIQQCIPEGFQLPVLITLFGQIAGVSMNTNALIASAVCIQQCVPKDMQLPVLIALAQQILNGGVATGGIGVGIVFGNYGGSQPTFTPASGTGAAFDTSIGRPWFYYNGAWN